MIGPLGVVQFGDDRFSSKDQCGNLCNETRLISFGMKAWFIEQKQAERHGNEKT